MFDSTSPYDIPATAQGVAGYVNGSFPWPVGSWDRFPNAAVKRYISLDATISVGNTLDVETGAAKPWQAPGWVKLRRGAGVHDLWIYCATSTWPDVLTAMHNAGQTADYWVADPRPVGRPPGLPHSLPGAIACQYAWPPESGGHYDLSLVDTATLVTAHEGAEMLSATDPKNGNNIVTNLAGEVYVFDQRWQPSPTGFLGGLNGHPEWQAGGTFANGPVVGIETLDDGNPALSAYVLVTQDAEGVPHPYVFPSSGILTKGAPA